MIMGACMFLPIDFLLVLKLKDMQFGSLQQSIDQDFEIDHSIQFSFFFEKPGVSRFKSFTFNEKLNIDRYFNFQF